MNIRNTSQYNTILNSSTLQTPKWQLSWIHTSLKQFQIKLNIITFVKLRFIVGYVIRINYVYWISWHLNGKKETEEFVWLYSVSYMCTDSPSHRTVNSTWNRHYLPMALHLGCCTPALWLCFDKDIDLLLGEAFVASWICSFIFKLWLWHNRECIGKRRS